MIMEAAKLKLIYQLAVCFLFVWSTINFILFCIFLSVEKRAFESGLQTLRGDVIAVLLTIGNGIACISVAVMFIIYVKNALNRLCIMLMFPLLFAGCGITTFFSAFAVYGIFIASSPSTCAIFLYCSLLIYLINLVVVTCALGGKEDIQWMEEDRPILPAV
jgi:hypothetical protein